MIAATLAVAAALLGFLAGMIHARRRHTCALEEQSVTPSPEIPTAPPAPAAPSRPAPPAELVAFARRLVGMISDPRRRRIEAAALAEILAGRESDGHIDGGIDG